MIDSVLSDGQYRDYLDDLLSGNRQACTRVVQRLLDEKISVRSIYLNLFQRSLYDVGSLWERNQVSVAVEHLATAITENLLTLVYPVLFRSERVNKKAVIACVASEYHQIGGKMVADVFELNGWDSYFLGANTPAPDLIDMISRTEPDIVGLSLAVYSHLPGLNEAITRIRSQFPDVKVIAGGQAFSWGGAEMLQSYSGVSYVPTVEQLELLISAGTDGA
ncbi:MAG: cobalamin-binding protein [Spirochaetaceae bacterium]|nr:MAG: cobalamin-binding protein [Spirochaetaceae bacterium]